MSPVVVIDNAGEFNSVGKAAASGGYGYDRLGRLTAIDRASGASTSTVGDDTDRMEELVLDRLAGAATLGRNPIRATMY